MKPLILLGCSGNAYDVLDIVDALNAASPTWKVIGFLDDTRSVESRFLELPILGRVADAPRFADAQFVNTIGSEKSYRHRPEIIATTKLSRERFATLVHPAAAVSSRASLGHGVYVSFGASIAGAVAVGDHVSIGASATIGHDTTIGNYSIIAPQAVVSGFVKIGVACYLGAAAAIKQNVSLGDGALIGMAAVVTRDVIARSVVVGNPARPVNSIVSQ